MLDITERRQAEAHQQVLLYELQHRVKNILATVTALARRTGGDFAAAEEATAALVGRLQAMARTHELLSRDLWRGVALDALLRATLEPYLGSRDDEILIAGPPVVIDPKASSILGMVLYELASDAASTARSPRSKVRSRDGWRSAGRSRRGTGGAGCRSPGRRRSARRSAPPRRAGSERPSSSGVCPTSCPAAPR